MHWAENPAPTEASSLLISISIFSCTLSRIHLHEIRATVFSERFFNADHYSPYLRFARRKPRLVYVVVVFRGRWHVNCYIDSCGLTSQTKKGKIDEHAQYCRPNFATADPVRDLQDRTNVAGTARPRRNAGHQPRLVARSPVDAGSARFHPLHAGQGHAGDVRPQRHHQADLGGAVVG